MASEMSEMRTQSPGGFHAELNGAKYTVEERVEGSKISSTAHPKKLAKLSIALLRNYYPVVITLGEYLSLDESQPPGLHQLFKAILVGLHADQKKPMIEFKRPLQLGYEQSAVEKMDDVVTMAQLMEAAQSILIWRSNQDSSKSGYRKSNVLTLGCRSSNETYPELAIPAMNGPYANGLVSTHAACDMTTNKFIVQSYFFADLLGWIGPKQMIQLLTDTAMYYPTGDNCCYFQITGQPIFELPILQHYKQPKGGVSLVDVILSKNTLMYTRINPNRTGTNQMGFPVSHVLSQLHHSSTSLPDDRLKAIHLSKYIFPSQFCLTSFNSTTHSDAVQRLRPYKTPQRIKKLIQPNSFLLKIVLESKTVKLKPILNRYCRSKLMDCKLSEGEKLSLVELTQPVPSENSMQVDTLTIPGDIQMHDASGSAKSSTLPKWPTPKLSQFVCSPYDVESFIWDAIKAYGLSHWWGPDSKHNEKIVRKNIRRIITMRRFEKISLHELVQNLKFKECAEWISQNSQDHTSQQMLHDFIWWFYFCFVGELIKNTFFVTESAVYKNRTLYFRLDDWQQICRPLIKYLKTTLFSEVDESESKKFPSQLGYSFLRLLPKGDGVRPIVNLKRKSASTTGLSTNSILQNLFSVLTYEKNMFPDKMGASVLGWNQIYTQFKNLKNSLGPSIPNLYFVKVDIRACFDTIQQDKILQIISEIFSEDQYIIQKYAKIRSALTQPNKISKTFKRQAYPSDEVPDFDEFVFQVSKALKKRLIFSDQVKYSWIDRADLMNLLKEHITQNCVKIEGQRHRQKNGIPQGSILSPLLCSLFYADMDKQRLGFTKTPNSLLIRLIDDFIYVTPDQGNAERFLKVMTEGSREYGCFISPEKTLINFKLEGTKQVVGDEFPWCGILINTKTLEFKADITRTHGFHISDTLTVDQTRTPGTVFCQKMYLFLNIRMHIIYLDSKLNSIPTVLLNIYQSFRVTAAKYLAYVVQWGADTIKNWKFFHRVIERLIVFVFACCQQQISQEYVKKVGGECQVKSRDITWLGRQAFQITLSRRPNKFGPIVKQIQSDLNQQSKRINLNRKNQIMLQSIINSKSNRAFEGLKF